MTWLGADELDLLVLGSGVAGLSAAVRAADELACASACSPRPSCRQAATRWAQGGVAAVLGGDPDSTDLHLADTLAAGVGLCDVDAVRVLVDEGPSRVNELIAMGAMFDRDREGRLLLAREGGHSLPRIVHAGGAATGAEIERALVDEVRETAAALLGAVVRRSTCSSTAAAASACVGDGPGRAGSSRSGPPRAAGHRRRRQLFAATTNPLESTGDGLAMALRAGVAVRRRRVRAVPPDRAVQPEDAATAAVGGAARATAR